MEEERIIDLWKQGYSKEQIAKTLLLGYNSPTTAKFEKNQAYINALNRVEKAVLKFYGN